MPLPTFISCLYCLVLRSVNRGLKLLRGARNVCSLMVSNAVEWAVYSFQLWLFQFVLPWQSLRLPPPSVLRMAHPGTPVCHWHQPCGPGSGSEGCFRQNKIISSGSLIWSHLVSWESELALSTLLQLQIGCWPSNEVYVSDTMGF